MQEEIDALKSALDSKLDAGRVTDSTSVTEAGWAVDARQANASISGSIRYDIEKLKGINVHEFSNEDILIEGYIFRPTYIKKFYGGLCILSVQVANVPEGTLLKIPTGFIPKESAAVLASTNNGQFRNVLIDIEGNVKVGQGDYGCFFVCTYFSKDGN